jgi:hypothetical protein
MDTEIAIQGIDRGGKGKTERDTKRIMRMAGDNDTGMGDTGRSCAYVFVGTAEAFTLAHDENTKREERRVLSDAEGQNGGLQYSSLMPVIPILSGYVRGINP